MMQARKSSEKVLALMLGVLSVSLILCDNVSAMLGKFQWQEERSAVANGILLDVFQFPQGTLRQFKSDGVTAIPESGSVMAGTVTLGISFASDVIVPLRLQVEVRPASSSFAGTPTAVSGIILLSKQGTVTVSGLANGSYHWRGRLANVLTDAVSPWQEFGAVGGSDFTVALREPVVIVPGISGSVLVKSSDGSEAWPNIGKMLVSPSDSYLDALALDAAGNDSASTIRVSGILADAKLAAGNVTLFSDDFYGNLIDAFKNEGYIENQNLFTAPYDWRLDITKSVSVLTAQIAQAVAVSPTGKINIVAHSMGGLVLKKYLAGLTSGASAALLDKVILVGVPELGAPYAFKILNYGDDLNIPIANQNEIKKIAQNMPAIYELLPSRRYVGVVGGYVQDFRDGKGDAFLDYAGASTVLASDPADSRNVALLNVADNFHQAIDNTPVAAPSVYNIAGCGKPTITGFDLYDAGAIDLERGSGDGTVPEVSAMDLANAAHDYFVLSGQTGIDHTGLMSDARPVAFIKNIVDGNLAAALPQGISMREADCTAAQSSASSSSDSTIEFSATGSENLGVYDAAGDFTGLTASGTVALGIPGSEYDQLASSTFVLVPAGSDYRAVSGATASGTLAMKVRGYRSGIVDRQATYLSVPISDTSTVAELDFSGFDKNMDLKLGHRGHANVLRIHRPDSVISAAANLKDRTPPMIIVTPLPRTVMQNATATLAFSATDVGSGIATTTATFNGATVANGAILSFTQPGKNILVISATDNAGNPRTKKIEIDVRAP
jgi:hypothetical protein